MGSILRTQLTARPYLARLDVNGSVDSSFKPATGIGDPHASLRAVGVQPDGKVLMGGFFSSVAQANHNGIARLNANGNLDSSFNAITDGAVLSLAVQPDGKIIRGGQNLARVDAAGSLDQTFNVPTGTNGWVYSVVVQSDARVLIGGLFGTVEGTVRSNLARLHADGSVDGGFDAGTIDGGIDDSRVNSLASQADGKILVGGTFTRINGTARSGIARLNPDGSLDSTFDPGIIAGGSSSSTGGGWRTEVNSLRLQADGKVLAGGNFTMVNGVARWRVARLLGDSLAPSLEIALSNGFAVLSWPESTAAWRLQETPDLTLPDSWIAVTQPAVPNGGQLSVTVPIAPPRKYFRLISP